MIPRIYPGFGLKHLAALGAGPDAVRRFERSIAERLGCPDALFLPRGRTAAYLFLKSFGPGEVILPAYTCLTLPPAILAAGHRAVFVDNAENSFQMDLARAARACSDSTRCVIATPMYGLDADWEAIAAIQRKGVPVLLDAALALGQCLADPKALERVDAALFAFGLGKEVSTISGGMLVSRDAGIVAAARRFWEAERLPSTGADALRIFGALPASIIAFRRWAYPFLYRVSERTSWLDGAKGLLASKDLPKSALRMPLPLQAGLGLLRLPEAARVTEIRKRLFDRYSLLLAPLESSRFRLPPPASRPSYYPILTSLRDRIAHRMVDAGIHAGTRVFDYVAGAETAFSDAPGEFPTATAVAREVLLLPLHEGVTESDQDRIVAVVARALKDDRTQ